ncbi:MAG TPA: rhamnulokinase [Erysipelotrichaceae bacterium]|nr:rhamnulokinase [Erysipelotrichaceae bacterium]
MDHFLAVDIGASSGRHILGSIENEKLVLEEIYRFSNNVSKKEGSLVWDTDRLFREVIEGMKQAAHIGKIPKSMAIDTWAVDYMLLDEKDQELAPLYAYRDPGHAKGAEQFHKTIPFSALYERNGLQYQPFNTIYQLASRPETLKDAKHFLMVPDYLAWKLTGIKSNEYTNLSTTGLINVHSHDLDDSLLEQTKITNDLFGPVKIPGECIGPLSDEISGQVGYSCEVVACASHDTASAFLASIGEEIILSSGTWSLIGITTAQTHITEKARNANFSHEGSFDRNFRFLKNIMGLWIIQEVRRDLNEQYSFADLVKLAKADPYPYCFDVNKVRFLKPDCMSEEIKTECAALGYPPIESIGQLADCVYRSLALATKTAVEELESITQKAYATINIVGGGSQNEYLNELIAEQTNKRIIAGPIEATALGNIGAQLMGAEKMKAKEIKELIRKSFPYKEYQGGRE